MKLEEIINQRRKEFGLTKKELASLVQADISIVDNLVRGRGNINLQTLNQMLQVLGIDFNTIDQSKETINLFVEELENKLEEFENIIKKWNMEDTGGYHEVYHKEFITLQNKKVIIQLSNSVSNVWILYTNDTKTSFMTESKLNKLLSAGEEMDYPEISSTILEYQDTLEEDEHEYMITPLGKSLFNKETLTEIAKLSWALM